MDKSNKGYWRWRLYLTINLMIVALVMSSVVSEVKAVTTQEINAHIKDLQNINFKIANDAGNSLTEIGSPAVPALISVLKNNKDEWVRIKALNVLARIEDKEAISAMLIAINDQSILVRDTLRKNLVKLHTQGEKDIIPLLVESLVDSDYLVRITAFELLTELGISNDRFATYYLNLYEASEQSAEKLLALQGLSRLGAQATVVSDQLLALLKTENEINMRFALMNTIAAIGGSAGEQIYPMLILILLEGNWAERQEAIWILRRLGIDGDTLVSEVIQSWQASSEMGEVHALEVVEHLAYTQKEAIGYLLSILNDPSQDDKMRLITYELLESMLPQLEYHLERGLVAVLVPEGVYVGWRLLGIEDYDTAFNIYRDGVKVNEQPIISSTNYLDYNGTVDSKYTVCAIVNNVEQASSHTAIVWEDPYLTIPLQQVPGDDNWGYTVNDASVGDLDGDGEYEIIFKRIPPATDGNWITEDKFVLFEAYKLDGTFLWRINIGPNINTAVSLQFLVYDLDGDGCAEVIIRTADGTIDGLGNIVGKAGVDYRPQNPAHILVERTEYLSVFDGRTGQEIARTEHIQMGNSNKWGDDRGHRADSRRAAIAYLDGQHPSIIIARGAYELIEIRAIDLIDGSLVTKWDFSSADWPGYSSQGFHSLSVADVDGDGKDEIIYGGMTLDSDGTGLYTTNLGHGDALHVGDFITDRAGLEVFAVQENVPSPAGINMRDARTGEIIWGVPTDYDVSRGLTANIDPNSSGNEVWAARSSLYSAQGEVISKDVPGINFAIWWDGDLLREINSDIMIDKWDYENKRVVNLLRANGCISINGSKANPAIQADILGDWREEIVWPSANNKELRIYTTTHLTEHRLYTLMHNKMYRLAIAWQNVGYNQPPHPDFYIGPDMQMQDFNWGLVKRGLEQFL